MNCEYVRVHYGVPACIGRRVIAYGKPGIISADRGNYIGVTLDSEKPGTVNNYHPADGIEYGELGKIRPMTRSQARYRDYQDVADCYESFYHYLKCKEEERRYGLNPNENEITGVRPLRTETPRPVTETYDLFSTQ